MNNIRTSLHPQLRVMTFNGMFMRWEGVIPYWRQIELLPLPPTAWGKGQDVSKEMMINISSSGLAGLRAFTQMGPDANDPIESFSYMLNVTCFGWHVWASQVAYITQRQAGRNNALWNILLLL